MAWNRPSEDGRANTPGSPRRGRSPRPTVAIRGAIAGAIVVIGAAVAAWWLWLDASAPVAEGGDGTKNGLIREVTPAAAPKAVEKTPAEKMRERYPGLAIPDDWAKPYPPQAYRADGSLKEHSRYVKVVTNVRHHVSVQEKTFKRSCDRRIAGLLIRNPGDTLVGDVTYGEDFVEDFRESLKDEIRIEDTDTDFQRRLKAAVIEARRDLKARMDAGEDIAKVMTESRKELKELGLYREELRKQVERIREEHDGEFSEKDERELVEAANRMLEERGCKPLEMPKIFVKQMEMMK